LLTLLSTVRDVKSCSNGWKSYDARLSVESLHPCISIQCLRGAPSGFPYSQVRCSCDCRNERKTSHFGKRQSLRRRCSDRHQLVIFLGWLFLRHCDLFDISLLCQSIICAFVTVIHLFLEKILPKIPRTFNSARIWGNASFSMFWTP
jgi:hypothetical protein